MIRLSHRLTISAAMALAATGVLAQTGDGSGTEDPAQIAAETRDALQRSSEQGGTSEPATRTAAQPETQKMLEQLGAEPAQPTGGIPVVPQSADGQTSAGTTKPESDKAPPTAQEIESASHSGGPLPEGQSALTVKTQILLDHAGISPGIIDGWSGGMSQSAIAAFETREGLPVDGQLDASVWTALGGAQASGLLQSYTVTAEDLSGLSAPLPEDYAKLAELDRLGYTSVTEKLAERFHMDEEFLKTLNPGVSWEAGSQITVAAPGPQVETKVARIEIRKPTGRLAAFDAEGHMVANYPVTVGSSSTPSPSGTVEVVAVAMDPTYSYDPEKNFQQGDNDEFLVLPPGPNGPVGSVWIDLSKPTYGLHGTSEPDSLFQAASHGCVRLTNWDVEELAGLVSEGVTVEFVE